MLSPNLNETEANIAAGVMQFIILRGFSEAIQDTKIAPLSPDPAYLGPMRQRISELAKECAHWLLNDYPQSFANYLLPFTDYATSFQAFADQAPKFKNDLSIWNEALDALHENLETAKAKSKTATDSFDSHLKAIKLKEGLLDQSLTDAWNDLADDESKIVAIAKEVTALQDRVAQLQDDLTSSEISNGKSYFQTLATISYNVLIKASGEIPYLSIVSSLYTVGKMAYDLIVTDKQIEESLQRIADLAVEESETIQAAAMAKAVIHLINSLDLRLSGVNDHLPKIAQMWETEAEKVAAAKDAINSGATPSEVFDLVSMPSAASAWNTLAKLSRNAITIPAQTGKPVTLSVGAKQPELT